MTTPSSNTTSGRFRALESRRRRDEANILVENEMKVAEASLAASELSDLLEQFTSKKLGTTSTLSSSIHNPPYNFMNHDDPLMEGDNEEDNDDEMDDDYYDEGGNSRLTPDPMKWLRKDKTIVTNKHAAISMATPQRLLAYTKHPTMYSSTTPLPMTTPHSTTTTMPTSEQFRTKLPNMERADTPVMSNASARKVRKQQLMNHASSLSSSSSSTSYSMKTPMKKPDTQYMDVEGDDDYEEEEDEEMPVNVQSPWLKTPITSSTLKKSIPGTASRKRLTQQQQQQQQPTNFATRVHNVNHNTIDFQRYYDTLCNFVKSKRNVIDNMMIDHDQDDDPVEGMHRNSNSAIVLTTTQPSYHQTSGTHPLSNKECRVDTEFLQHMRAITYNMSLMENDEYHKTIAYQESCFWNLVSMLRPLGLASILFDDDKHSFTQHQYAVQGYIQKLASEYVEKSPKDVVDAFYGHDNEFHNNHQKKIQTVKFENRSLPFLLQRRHCIVQWLEYNFNQKLPPNIMMNQPFVESVKSHSNNIMIHQTNLYDKTKQQQQQQQHQTAGSGKPEQYKSHLLVQGLIGTNEDDKLLEKCFSLIVAGRLDDALKVVRETDATAWRATLWNGGKPHGYDFGKKSTTSMNNNNNENDNQIGYQSTGNPNRALWRRMIWKLAEPSATVLSSGKHNEYETAIAAILSSNVRAALDCVHLSNTWEHGLYVVYKSMMDRTLDELLHYHNNNRRQRMKENHGLSGFPGVQFEQYERDQLQATSDIATLDDMNAVALVNSRPMQFGAKQVTKSNPIIDATSSILVGKSSISALMAYLQFDFNNPTDIVYQRFMTHVAIYLDSLSTNTSLVPLALMQSIAEWKNELVIQYIIYLASLDDLWYTTVVYASLLPESVVLVVLPNLLVNLESQKEREVIVHELHEYLSIRKDKFDVEVLRRVVRLILSREDDESEEKSEEDEYGYALVPSVTRLDIQKMNSLLWLTIEDEHTGDALIAINILIRQFMLEVNGYKLREVKILLSEVLPPNLLQRVDTDDEGHLDTPSLHRMRVDHAQSDFLAFQSYIMAMDALDHWIEVINATSATGMVDDDVKLLTNTVGMSATEISIAESMERRKFLEEKRNATRVVVLAAGDAESFLWNILTYQGGWLLTDDEMIPHHGNDQTDDENMKEIDQRKVELKKLRAELLPKVVTLYENVCSKTAHWMYSSMNHAKEHLFIAPLEDENYCVRNIDVIKLIDETIAPNTDDDDHEDDDTFDIDIVMSSPLSPLYWSEKVYDLANVCASDQYGMKSSAFEHVEDYENLVKAIAENAIQHLIYQSAFPDIGLQLY